MDRIDFSECFDKLKSDVFTTVRKYSIDNVAKYLDLNKIFDVYVKGNYYCKAEVTGIDTLSGDDIDEDFLKEDTMVDGKIDYEWYNKILGMGNCLILTFKKVVE